MENETKPKEQKESDDISTFGVGISIGIIIGIVCGYLFSAISLYNLVENGATGSTILSVFSVSDNLVSPQYLVGGTGSNSVFMRDECLSRNSTIMLVSCANPLTGSCSFSCYR